MRPYVEELAQIAGDTFVSCYPNAGLPNPMSETGFDETPEITAGLLEEFADVGLPQHRRRLLRHHARAHRADRRARRPVPAARAARSASCRGGARDGRRCAVGPRAVARSATGSLFVNIGERTNVTGSKAFARLILNGQFEEALGVARQQVENGAQVIDINMDEAMLDSQGGDGALPEPDRRRARDRARADHDRQLEVGGDRGRPAVHPGQGHRQLDLDEGRRGRVHAPGQAGAAATAPPRS